MNEFFAKFEDIHLITLGLGAFLIFMFIYHTLFDKKKSPEDYAFDAMEKIQKEEQLKSRRVTLSSVYGDGGMSDTSTEAPVERPPLPIFEQPIAVEERPEPVGQVRFAVAGVNPFRSVGQAGRVRTASAAKVVSELSSVYEWE
jgi:hypothetical protein